ncbi:carboxymuconolactone decarboxylase family protein [Kitasatospora sp. LaBMicrA B282]|uniref:carboxymuconolactone decarboxylase family protein n=1 Tax=Kitasatospora sp. LaBMicrA B282 TaxID=3420949 RepID=UPI003D11CD6F
MAPTTENGLAQQRSRMSDPIASVPELKEISTWMYRSVDNGSVSQITIGLTHLRAGQIVRSTYLAVMHTDVLRQAGETEERITSVATWRDASCFTAAERAALALTEAVLEPRLDGERVSDELFAEAAAHFDEKALATLCLALGQVTYFIPLALIGKPLPGKPYSEQWT